MKKKEIGLTLSFLRRKQKTQELYWQTLRLIFNLKEQFLHKNAYGELEIQSENWAKKLETNT